MSQSAWLDDESASFPSLASSSRTMTKRSPSSTRALHFELCEDTPLGGGKPLGWSVRSAGPRLAAACYWRGRTVLPRRARHRWTKTGGRVFLFLETDNFDRDHARNGPPPACELRPGATARGLWGVVAVF